MIHLCSRIGIAIITLLKTMISVLVALAMMATSGNSLVFDFGTKGKQISSWSVLSDQIMGGVSQTDLKYNDEAAQIKGVISLDNFGGYSSIRSAFSQFDLSTYKTVTVRYRGKGQQFSLMLQTSRDWTRPNFKLPLGKASADWQTVTLSLMDFKEYQVGSPTGRGITLEALAGVQRIGFETSEKKEGPFEVEVDYIRFE